MLMSPSIFKYALQHQQIPLVLVNTLVIDSCQHVMEEDHLYGQIMQYYFVRIQLHFSVINFIDSYALRQMYMIILIMYKSIVIW